MSYSSKLQVKESVSELNSLLHKEKNYKIKQRIKGLILFKEHPDKSQETLSNKLGIGYSTYRLWLKQYSEKGINSFLLIKAKGKPKSVISAELHCALEQKVNDSNNPLKGYWEAVIWVEEQFGEIIKYQSLRAYLIKNFKTKLKMPRKSHYKKDQQAIEAFKKTS